MVGRLGDQKLEANWMVEKFANWLHDQIPCYKVGRLASLAGWLSFIT